MDHYTTEEIEGKGGFKLDGCTGRIKQGSFDKGFSIEFTEDLTEDIIKKTFKMIGESVAIQFKLFSESESIKFGIGEWISIEEFGMWYGPISNIDECLEMPGRSDNSHIIKFYRNGDHEILYKWSDIMRTWMPNAEDK